MTATATATATAATTEQPWYPAGPQAVYMSKLTPSQITGETCVICKGADGDMKDVKRWGVRFRVHTSHVTPEPSLGNIAAEFGVTLEPAGPFDVAVFLDGVRVRTSPQHDTHDRTLGWAIVDLLRKDGRWVEWAFVMTLLRPGTTTEEWLAVAEKLQSN